MKKAFFFPLQVSLCTVCCFYASSGITQAQVTSDGTVNTQVNQDGNSAVITGGETRGGNLFHSFQDFSVPTGNEAFFNNADSIQNIFSRVTGGNISNIDGLIRANGDASLFLINPAGIIFGENARLDIGGSFYGSSASSILFEDGEFSAVDNLQQPVLTINAPIGLNFRDDPGNITVRNDGNGARQLDSEIIDTQNALRVDSSATIGIVGGNLFFENATVKTAGGRIELGSVAEGTVDLIAVENGFTLGYSNIEAFRDITLSGNSVVDASGVGGGDIQVAGNSISLTGISDFTTNTLGSEPGGDINIFAADSIEISGVENELNFASAISNRVFPSGTADAGDINIETGSLTIGDLAFIGTSSIGQGNAGSIKIDASDSITIESQGNFSAILSNIANGASGNGGSIDITTPSLTLSNGGLINANTSGQGNAGKITVNATNSIILESQDNNSVIASNVDSNAIGNGGNVNLTTGSLALSNGAFVTSNTLGQGNAGNIIIDANSLSLTSGSFFSANANSSQGNAGNININANETVSLDGIGTGFFTNVRTAETVGNGGNIEIITGSLSISNQATLDTTSFGQGNAGNVTINANNFISLEGNDPSSLSNTPIQTFVSGNNAQGNAGNIEINTGSLALNNGAGLLAANVADGKAGNVIIDATGNVSFANGSNIFATGAPGGSINLNAKNLSISSGSIFFAGITSENNSSAAPTGDISINLAEDLIIDGLNSDDSTYINNSSFGTGNPGNVEITARNITFQNGGSIASFSEEQETVSIGNITLSATGDIVFDGIKSFQRSGILNQLPENTSGSIGEINLTAQNLTLTNGAAISSLVAGNGDSGNINIDVANSISIDGFGEATTENSSGTLASAISTDIFRTGTGNGGTININTQNLELSRNGLISSQVLGKGNGGNININAESLLGIQERTLNPQTNDINASSELSLDGTININILSFDPIQGVTELSQNVVESQETTAQACQSDRNIAASNQLTIQGKGGTIADPAESLDSASIIVDGQVDNNSASVPAPIETAQGKIQPARGIKVTESGEVILTAYHTDNAGNRLPIIASSCGSK